MKIPTVLACESGPNFIEYLEDLPELADVLMRSARHHRHICPRQVLGGRIGLAGVRALGMPVRPEKKELLVISETDGCFLSGLEAASDVSVNHRTLRIADYGKIAATFVHVESGHALRLSLAPDVRERAWMYARPGIERHYFAMLTGYQNMPVEELLVITPVALTRPARQLISRPGIRTICAQCGEEVINEREVWIGSQAYCTACAGQEKYYK